MILTSPPRFDRDSWLTLLIVVVVSGIAVFFISLGIPYQPLTPIPILKFNLNEMLRIIFAQDVNDADAAFRLPAHHFTHVPSTLTDELAS